VLIIGLMVGDEGEFDAKVGRENSDMRCKKQLLYTGLKAGNDDEAEPKFGQD